MLKYYLCLYLLLYLVQTFAQTSLIAKHSFEETGDTWPLELMSTPPCSQQGDTWNYHTVLGEIVPSEGDYFWGIQDLNGNCGSSGFEYIEFTSLNIEEFRNVVLTFKVQVKGFDNGDDMKYQLWLDDVMQPEVLFIDGQNDFTHEDWTTVHIEIPNAISIVKLRISIKQNGSDIAGLDQIRLDGTPIIQCSELMISEYLEGGSSVSHRNNFIELYNPSDIRVDLSSYQLVKYTAANTELSAKLQLSGFLEPFASFLVKDDAEILNISADLSTNSAVMNYNGDDKIALQKNEEIIDLVGHIGDSINFAKDITLRRKSNVKNANNEYDPNEWDSYGFEDVSDLGFHASYCQGSLPEIELYGRGQEIFDGSTSSTLTNNSYFGAWPVSKDTLITRKFTIKNTGNKSLDIGKISLLGSDSMYFSTNFNTNQSVAINDSIEFVVRYQPGQKGIHTARLEIINSDPSENPFDFTIQGEGTGPAAHPLIISQYYEGNANNKWIEVTNTGNISSPDNTYYLALFRNETTLHPIGTKPSNKKLIPSILPGQSVKYAAILNVTAPAYAIDGREIKTNVCSFSGDDILVISTSDKESCWAERTDIIGYAGNWGTNLSMVRKYGCDGSSANTGFQESDWLTFSIEEIDLAKSDSNTSIGTHNSGRTIWQGASWSNGKPDTNRSAVIESYYATDIHGAIEACNLHIAKGARLIVRAADYIRIQNDLSVEGSLDIMHEGSLIMQDDTGKIENSGSISIHKTNPGLKPFDYTYWSSPVQSAKLETVFWNSPKNSFYFFSTKDFEDLNDDGLDDDNNAWVSISGDMQVGRGYTSMAPNTTPFSNIEHVTFNGIINNGIIEIPVYAQSGSTPKQHYWNLVGNPYPSAIDAELLFDHPENKNLLSRTLYFWTHSTPASEDPSTGELSYSSNDYAMYTIGTGGIKAHPNGKEPTQYISSCQGFFIEALQEGQLIFDNAMRTPSGNDNFYKSNRRKNEKKENKIWLNLTNEEGAFSQILIGFLEGATAGFDHNFDGLRIDAQNPVNFYSLDQDHHYGIQGLPNFKGNEKVKLGLFSRIQEETLMQISIDHIKGNFANKDILLKDKSLNKKHKLMDSPYSFVLNESGKVNDRFELVFGHGSADDLDSISDQTKIVWQLIDDILLVRTNNKDTIYRLEIFDLNGRKLKDQKNPTNLARIQWSGLPARSIYILRVHLQDSKTIISKILP